jgi:archaellin
MTIDIRRFRYVAAALAAVLVAAGAYAFTASNTVPGSNAGSGSGTISGYAVSNVAYTLDSDPSKIDAVTLTLDKTAGTVKIQLDTVAGDWYACTNTSGNDWSCDTTSPQATVTPADKLTVVATD